MVSGRKRLTFDLLTFDFFFSETRNVIIICHSHLAIR